MENERSLSFRSAAKMIKMLGEHLIRDNTTGVLELIKNGYDADASKVSVELKHLKDPEKTVVIIDDDGIGMDEATIRYKWCTPACDGKQKEKDECKKTALGRLPLGEKGVGRFATQKLGRYLDMVTRPKESRYEYYIHIDWQDFDKTDAYLDEIKFDLDKRKPLRFLPMVNMEHV